MRFEWHESWSLRICKFWMEEGRRAWLMIDRWCDTVCINKDNAVELNENISSMGDYYKNAHTCLIVSRGNHLQSGKLTPRCSTSMTSTRKTAPKATTESLRM